MANQTDTPKGLAPFDLYPYNPAQAPAFAFMALFGIVGIMHIAVLIPYRSWFPIPLIIGCGMETAAYYFRTESHDDVRKTLPFLLQNLLLLAAPPRRKHIYLFILVDTVCFVIQVAGAIMSGSEQADEAQRGRMLIIVGLVLQIVAFGLFAAWTAVFHRRMASATDTGAGQPGIRHWQRYVYGLYAISLLFVVRNTTRLIEYNEGPGGEMLSSEVYLYALEGTTMLLIVAVFVAVHPGRLRMHARGFGRKQDVDETVELRRVTL
ncbi:RTA1 like protein-domain-containing protein [Microdochium trichocladiopsis]|uniref:RTA1 like protein-domain-containing protein n=1 Tax=Microdochium trichocladiopsis TaxID=1682393 RepID=A0A9P8Y5V1_9PEZI|nr:RTA1 like protein-domain-containing protein [Microdochium trichocladiopsis]KAH7029610.1 RTA1 like protein-domain-containing protein [Microdochium trichocladiopsis]